MVFNDFVSPSPSLGSLPISQKRRREPLATIDRNSISTSTMRNVPFSSRENHCSSKSNTSFLFPSSTLLPGSTIDPMLQRGGRKKCLHGSKKDQRCLRGSGALVAQCTDVCKSILRRCQHCFQWENHNNFYRHPPKCPSLSLSNTPTDSSIETSSDTSYEGPMKKCQMEAGSSHTLNEANMGLK